MAKVATITLNAAYDLVGRLSRIEIGEVNTVETLGLFPAGKGIKSGHTDGTGAGVLFHWDAADQADPQDHP